MISINSKQELDFQHKASSEHLSTTKQLLSLTLNSMFQIQFYFLYRKITEFFFPPVLISPTLSRQLLPLWARSYSSSTSCQEVGIVAYVSSSMSVHEGERGGWEQAVGGKKHSQRAERAFTEFRFCVLTADTAELTHKLMREGKKFPFQPLKGWDSF